MVVVLGVVIFALLIWSDRKKAKDLGLPPFEHMGEAFGGWLVIALPVSLVVYLFVPKPPPTEAEIRERILAAQEARREHAQECQHLFAVWNAGMATDDQKEDLQDCVRDFGNN